MHFCPLRQGGFPDLVFGSRQHGLNQFLCTCSDFSLIFQHKDDCGRLWNATRQNPGHGCPRSETCGYIRSYIIYARKLHVIIFLQMTLTGKQSGSGWRWAVERRQLSSGSGGWQPGSAMPDPGQRAASGREAGLRVLWGGEEGGLAHTHWESGKKLQPNKSERLSTNSRSNVLRLIWFGFHSVVLFSCL